MFVEHVLGPVVLRPPVCGPQSCPSSAVQRSRSAVRPRSVRRARFGVAHRTEDGQRTRDPGRRTTRRTMDPGPVDRGRRSPPRTQDHATGLSCVRLSAVHSPVRRPPSSVHGPRSVRRARFGVGPRTQDGHRTADPGRRTTRRTMYPGPVDRGRRSPPRTQDHSTGSSCVRLSAVHSPVRRLPSSVHGPRSVRRSRFGVGPRTHDGHRTADPARRTTRRTMDPGPVDRGRRSPPRTQDYSTNRYPNPTTVSI